MERGRGSARSRFFHVTHSRDDDKWRIKEVHGGEEFIHNTKEEAINKAKELANKTDCHVVIHRDDGTFEIIINP